MLKKKFGAASEEGTGERTDLHKKEHYNLYPYKIFVRSN
jgi:hypothetical protein